MGLFRILTDFLKIRPDSFVFFPILFVFSLVLSGSLESSQNLIKFSYMFSWPFGFFSYSSRCYRIHLEFCGFYQILSNLPNLKLFSFSFEFSRTLGFYRIVPDFLGSYENLTGFSRVLLDSLRLFSNSICFSSNHVDFFEFFPILLNSL